MLQVGRETKVCKVCGKEFRPYSSNQKRCSICMEVPRYKKHNTLHKVICCVCGKEFETLLYNKKFCSPYCRGRYHYDPETHEHECAYCGEKFLTRKKQQKFCSTTCRMSAWLTKQSPDVANRILRCQVPTEEIAQEPVSTGLSLDDFLAKEKCNA